MPKPKHSFTIGQQFHNWSVVNPTPIGSPSKLLVKCRCGTEKMVDTHSLISGKSKRCRKCRVKTHAPNWRGINESVSGKLLSYESERLGVSVDELRNAYTAQSGTCSVTSAQLDTPRAVLTTTTTGPSVTWVSPSAYGLVNALGTTGARQLYLNNPTIFDALGFKRES